MDKKQRKGSPCVSFWKNELEIPIQIMVDESIVKRFKTYVINLPNRADRLLHAREECRKVDIRPIIFNAHEGKNSGLVRSVYEILKDETVLVLEDDVKFVNNAATTFEKAYKEIEFEDWDVLWLGAFTRTRLSGEYSNWLRLRFGFTTGAVIYNKRIIPTIKVLLYSYLDKGIPIDRIYVNHLQQIYKCYLINPMIAVQVSGFSDIQQRNTKHEYIKNFEKIQG